MHQDDIKFAREEIEKHRKDTPYGSALSTPWCILQEALDEIDRLKEEVGRLQGKCTARGARMQIMRDWIESSSEQDDWRQFVYRNPNVVDWFDEDGVPK